MIDPGRPPHRSRVRLVVVLGLVIVAVAAIASFAGFLALRDDDGPGAAAAGALAEDYVEALNRGDCSHYEYLSDGYLERRDTSVQECEEQLEFEPSYFEFELVDVRVEGDEGEIEIEAANDVGEVTMIASLAVQDGDWKVDDLEEVED